MDTLYRSSDVYVQTSLSEGFCLPALESLSRKTPVVYQTGTALDEVVSPLVGVGVTASASVKEWETAVCFASRLKREKNFQINLKRHFTKVSSWKEAAFQLNKLYNSL